MLRRRFFFRDNRQSGNTNLAQAKQEQVRIFNLSNKTLSKFEKNVLLKGLKFTPTPEKPNENELQTDLNEFFRKLKLREFFYEKDMDNDDSIVKNKSFFEPPKGRNQHLDSYIELTKQISTTIPKTTNKNNLSSNERKALDSLTKDTSIVIKEADKGSGIVIMNSYYYEEKIKEMLNDKTFYKKTNEQCTKATFQKIRKTISTGKDLTRKEIEYLINFDCKTSFFTDYRKFIKVK